jgi:hypothetical protein
MGSVERRRRADGRRISEKERLVPAKVHWQGEQQRSNLYHDPVWLWANHQELPSEVGEGQWRALVQHGMTGKSEQRSRRTDTVDSGQFVARASALGVKFEISQQAEPWEIRNPATAAS